MNTQEALKDSELVDIGNGMLTASEITFEIPVSKLPAGIGGVTVVAVYNPEVRKMVVDELTLKRPTGGSTTAIGTDLRQLPLREYLRGAMRECPPLTRGTDGSLTPVEFPAKARAAAKDAGGTKPETLQLVSQMVQYAQVMGISTAQYLSDELGVSYPTATNWMSRARKAGYLPEVRRGKAKENPDD